MKEWRTKNGYVISQLLNGQSSCYLIQKSQNLVLVDTGKRGRLRNIWKQLYKLKGEQSLNYIIQTHTHYDHCQNTARIKVKESCKLIASMHESHYTPKGYTPIPKGTYRLTKALSWFGRHILKGLFRYTPFEVDIPVDDHFTLKLSDFSIDIISTPGHSAGSLSVLIDKEYALVGDAMIGTFRNTIFSPFADNVPEMLNSWKKLIDTGCKRFLPGHGKEIGLGYVAKEYEKYSQKLNP